MATKPKIDTVGAREQLTPRGSPYWHRVRAECALGFRKQSANTPGVWVARFLDRDGKYKVRSFGALEQFPPFMRFDQAMKLALELFDHLDHGGSSEVATVADVCQRYLDKLAAEQKQSAVDYAQSIFERWVYPDQRLSKTPIQKLTPAQVTKWRATLVTTPLVEQSKDKPHTKPRTPSTINRNMTPFRSALNLALEDGLVTSAFAWKTKLKPIPNADRHRDTYVSPENRAKLLEHAEPYLADYLRCLCLLPVRPGVPAKLKARDFNKELGTLRIGIDKNHAERWITLPPVIANFFVLLCDGLDEDQFIFRRWDGSPWNKDAWKGLVRQAADAAGLGRSVTAITLRHSTITDLIVKHGCDALTVAKLAATSVRMIDRHYGHLLQKHAAGALEKLAI